MDMLCYEMEIIAQNLDFYRIKIADDSNYINIEYNPYTKEMIFPKDSMKVNGLLENKEQLKMLFKNKRSDTFYPGFKLRFSLRNKKDIKSYNNINNIIVLDKRKNPQEIYIVDSGMEEIHEVFIDGCYLEELGVGGYSIIIKCPKGTYTSYSYGTHQDSSSLIELIAAIKAMEILKACHKLRIVTDSQYVRKGLTEWIVNWKLNDWKTINGLKAKNIRYWKQFDKLTDGKYIEFQWVKAHSNQFENTLCDLMAKDAANNLTL